MTHLSDTASKKADPRQITQFSYSDDCSVPVGQSKTGEQNKQKSEFRLKIKVEGKEKKRREGKGKKGRGKGRERKMECVT